jgi:hypothetical protein
MSERSWLPLLFAAVAIVAAIVANRAARRRASGDSGNYWELVVRRICYWLGIPVLLSCILQSLSDTLWLSGWHLHFDRVWGSYWAFPLALAIPFALWLLLLIAGLRAPAPSAGQVNWLAGNVGFSAGRKWVLHCLWPLLIPLLWLGRVRLDLGTTGYPAATWSTLAVLTISLVGIAFSAPRTATLREEVRQAAAFGAVAKTLPDWPDAMRSEGLDLEALKTWRTNDPPEQSPSSTGGDEGTSIFTERLRMMGATGVAYQVSEMFSQIIASVTGGSPRPIKRLLIAPDDCGQAEGLALAAYDLAAQVNEVTLVICPEGDTVAAERIGYWLAQAARVFQRRIEVIYVKPGADLTSLAAVWVVDAATLSDDFIARLAEPELVTRIGFLVWWDIHAYTGVLAANLWAVSRRLDRIIQERRGSDIATLATLRGAAHADAELPAFVHRLLPYRFDDDVHVAHLFARTAHVYRLVGQKRYFSDPGHSSNIALRCRHLPLVAAYASERIGWPTHLDAPASVSADEREQILNVLAGGQKLRDLLAPSLAYAGARIMSIESRDALSLFEIISQGGRATDISQHYVGIVLPENPYVHFLMDTLARDGDLPASRRLFVAEGHETICRRHLLLALAELQDTRTSLLHLFRWEERIIQATLDEIANQGRLIKREVRYLDNRNNLVTEYIFRSTLAVGNQKRPLDAVGDHLFLVRDVDAPQEDGGIRMRLDFERRAIQAYPQRVFLSNGLRYRILDWNAEDADWVACTREAVHAVTWRIRSSQSIIVKSRTGQERNFGRSGTLLKTFPVAVRYQEYVDGVLRREYDLTNGSFQDRATEYPPIFCSFETRALVLRFLPRADEAALRALCLSLRHVLPVHLGVEEDALEVVPLNGQIIENQKVDGLAIVDLYPRGIGLVDAIHDDQQLIQNILEWTAKWLTEMTQLESGKFDASRYSPLAMATGSEEDLGLALSLLQQLVAVL